MKYFFLFVCGTLFALTASADLFKSTVFGLNTIYLDRDYDDNGVQSRTKMTDTDLRLTRVEKNWAYGIIYAMSSNDAGDANRTSYGISGGYYSEKDFYLNVHYFLASKYKIAGSEYTKGSGYQVDVGTLFKVTSSVYIGLLVALKNFSYSEMETAGTTSSISATHREVMPMFSLAIAFR